MVALCCTGLTKNDSKKLALKYSEIKVLQLLCMSSLVLYIAHHLGVVQVKALRVGAIADDEDRAKELWQVRLSLGGVAQQWRCACIT